MDENIYLRQSELKELEKLKNLKITIVGVGGIGSWVALNLALSGVNELILIDNDRIEEHNLNRTLFKKSQVGQYKTEAVKELISERRSDIRITTINKRIEQLNLIEQKKVNSSNLIVDCRDILKPLPEFIENSKYIKLGYDGYSFTIATSQKVFEMWWGESDGGYSVVPSCLVPPCLLSLILIVLLITDCDFTQYKSYTNDILSYLNIFQNEHKNE